MKTVISADPGLDTETKRVIYERRAIRKYMDKAVKKELIEQVIDAGRMAPSAMNGQPWKFYVLTDRDLIRSISREIAHVALKGIAKSGIRNILKTAMHLLDFSHGFHYSKLEDPVFYGAPVVIFITGPRENEWAPLDIGMCVQNMMLLAKSLGLESCPVGFAKFVHKTKLFTRLTVPGNEQVFLAVILGYGDEHPAIHERKKDNIIHVH
jgi:nitroreductase